MDVFLFLVFSTLGDLASVPRLCFLTGPYSSRVCSLGIESSSLRGRRVAFNFPGNLALHISIWGERRIQEHLGYSPNTAACVQVLPLGVHTCLDDCTAARYVRRML